MKYNPEMQQKNIFRITCLALIAITGWIALLLQYWSLLEYRSTTAFAATVRYFSYFTILSNLLVAICCSGLWLLRDGRARRFIAKPETLSAVAVYILVVGGIYNLVLRKNGLPQDTGGEIANELLHCVIPLLYLLFWVKFVPTFKMKAALLRLWLIYPLVYLFYTLIHGAVSGFYPYPFVNAGKIGYGRVLLNCLGVTVFFIVLSLLLGWIKHDRTRGD